MKRAASPTDQQTRVAQAQAELLPLRNEIDILDRQIIQLLVNRAKLARKIGDVKHRFGLAVFEKHREDAVLAKVERFRQAPLDELGLQRIYRAIMLTMRRLQVRAR